MPSASPNAQRRSFRQRIKDAILTLFCRPTRPPSPPQATIDLPADPDTQPDSPLEPTPPMLPIEDALAPKSISQAHPEDLPVEVGSAESLSCISSEPLEDVDMSAPGPVTVMDPPPISSTATIHGPDSGPPSSPQPSPTLAPAYDASTDEEAKPHVEPTLSLDTSPDDLHNDTPDLEQELHAGPSTIVSNTAPSTPTVQDGVLQPNIAVQGSSSGDGETQRQLYLTNVVITLSDQSALPVHLSELWVLGVEGGVEGKHIRLTENSPRMWSMNESVVLPHGADEVYCVAKDEVGNDIGFIQLEREGLHMSGGGQFVTEDPQLNLTMSWKAIFDVPPESVSDDEEHSTEIDAFLVHGTLDDEMRASIDQEGSMIGTFVDYALESQRLRNRYETTGNLDNLNESIVALQCAVQRTPEGHTDSPALLNDLAVSLLRRFERTGDMSNLTQAMATLQRVVQLTPQGHASLPIRLNNLGNSFLCRFKRTGDMADITQAIASLQQAVQLIPQGHADMPCLLKNLGNSFLHRFGRTGDMADITQAITTQQHAAQLTPQGHADVPGLLNSLGTSFRSRFEHTGDMADITQAITALQQAFQLIPQGHADLPGLLSNLGTSLVCRFERTGDMADITQAITSLQQAVQLTPQDHADLPGLLSNLGTTFRTRFEHTGDMADITQAITALQQAFQLIPQGHADLPGLLSNLGTSLVCRYERTGDMDDITQAIISLQQAVQLTPQGHSDLPSLFNNLGTVFRARFERTWDIADITQAITTQQQAAQLTPQGHANLPSRLSSLGTSFKSRFEHTGDMADISQAITTQQQAVQLTPQGHADLPMYLHNLGNSFKSRFEHTKAHSTEKQMSCEDMLSSVKCFTAATQCISRSPMVRLRNARQWARLLNCHTPESCELLVPFQAAVNLLNLVAGLEWTVQSRHSQLKGVSGITLEAAAAACRLGYPEKAVEWLEQGRCLVWGQLNGLRTPMDNLREQHPELADRLSTIAKQLEWAGSARAAVDPFMDISAKIPLEEAAQSHLALAREWEGLLSAVRELPSFESFLLPSPCSALLQDLPESGPIVVINCHEGRCDALALLRGSDQPLHIPLLNFSLEKAAFYRFLLKEGLFSNGFRMRQAAESSDKSFNVLHERAAVQDPDEDENARFDILVNIMLQCLWIEVAKPILDMLGYSKCDKSSTLPRIWWCPTGVMSFLPIHAAGIYNGDNAECVMDYVVSSYTPTVTAITDRVKRSPVDVSTSGLFLTSQPRVPGAAVIPGTTKEVEEVHTRAAEMGMRVLNRGGDDISVEDCRRYMEEFSSVHLACHASQNASDPLQSRFLLHNGELTLLSLIQMNLKNADLAFLSACQTSAGEEKLSDEAVHLAAGMLAAGYRRVVSTMWSINDNHAPRVATDFYDYLWKNRADETGAAGFDGSLSAHALHHAIQELRARLGNSERDLLTWIPYVHFGY